MAGTAARELLFTDFDGAPVDDPEEVIGSALDDARYRARIAPLTALLNDPSQDAYDRFLACCALASWAESAGYQAIVDAVGQASRVVWYEELLDNRYSVDETFTQLAAAVSRSERMAEEKDTTRERIAALRALLAIADEQYFDWQLAFALDEKTVPQVIDVLTNTVRRGIRRLTDGPRPDFDLSVQLADLISALTPTDESLAVTLASELVGVESSHRTITHLAGIVADGTTPASATFADYLTTIGDEEARQFVRQAFAQRANG